MKHTYQKISALRRRLLQFAVFLITTCPVLAQITTVIEPLAPRMNDAVLNQQTYTQDFRVLSGVNTVGSVIPIWR